MVGIEPQPGIMEIAPYQGGSGGGPGADNVVKLSANENLFGPSEAAVKAVSPHTKCTATPRSTPPACATSSLKNTVWMRIVVGALDEILRMLAEGYSGPGTEVIYTEHGFSMYRIVAWKPVLHRLSCPSASALLMLMPPEWRDDKTRLVYRNPANLTGTMLRWSWTGLLSLLTA